MQITVYFQNYKEPTLSFRALTKSIVMYGIAPSTQAVTDEYIDFENIDYNFYGETYPILSIVDVPYRCVLKSQNYEIPSISQHKIAFAINRNVPFNDNYALKVNKPKTFNTSVDSSFQITGVYLDEFVLQRTFNNIPNDLQDYEEEPGEDPVYDDYTNLTRLDYDK